MKPCYRRLTVCSNHNHTTHTVHKRSLTFKVNAKHPNAHIVYICISLKSGFEKMCLNMSSLQWLVWAVINIIII